MVKKPAAPGDVSAALVTALESLATKVNSIADSSAAVLDSVQTLSARIDKLETKATEVPLQEVVEGVSTPTVNDGILDSVNVILGDRFTYSMTPSEPGITFRLEVSAPKEIREFEDAKSAKVIPYAEGLAGIESFLRQVRDFYIGLCAKQGKPYDTYARTRT